MADRKLFKTKLCLLYQKGHCPRDNCSFAHGRAELRRLFYGREARSYQRGDLRDKLDKRFSPRRRFSSGRDAVARHRLQGTSGSSPSRSFERSRRHRKRRHLDQSDLSGSLKLSDGEEDNHGRKILSDTRMVIEKKLKEVISDINMLDRRKTQLRMLVDEKSEEANVLSSRLQELDSQLAMEKEESKRMAMKVMKFARAHMLHSKAQDDLRRSQDRLQRLGNKLCSDTAIMGSNGEDSAICHASDAEIAGHHALNKRNEALNSSPIKKTSLTRRDEESRFGHDTESSRRNKFKSNTNSSHFAPKDEIMDNRLDDNRSLFSDGNRVRGKNSSANFASDKGGESADVEGENPHGAAGAESGTAPHETSRSHGGQTLALLQNSYSQYEGEEENVDLSRLEEEMVDVDIV